MAEKKKPAPKAEQTDAPEEKVSVKVMIKVTSDIPVKIGSMTCAKGALAVLSKNRADALVKDGKAEIIY